jgi:hypothetical protein
LDLRCESVTKSIKKSSRLLFPHLPLSRRLSTSPSPLRVVFLASGQTEALAGGDAVRRGRGEVPVIV